MITDDQFKFIWYPAGNRVQLFDLKNDPGETSDLSKQAEFADHAARLTTKLIAELYGIDETWIQDGALKGFDAPVKIPPQSRNLSGQRGLHFPPIPVSDPKLATGVTDRWETKK
jgi:hypothetical protein